jgi:hypothetical protein
MGLLSSLLGGDMSGAGSAGLGILGQLGQGLSDNSGALLGFASGGPEGMIQGKKMDLLASDERQKQADKAAKIEWAKSIAPQIGMDPEVMAKNPEIAQQLYGHVMAAKLTPKTPQLVGSAETGYTWATPGQALPEQFAKGSGSEFDRLTAGMSEDEIHQAKLAKLGVTKSSDEITKYQQRHQMAIQQGLKPGDPAYQSFVLTGKMPREDAQPLSATDKKAIMEADDQVLAGQTAIDGLNKALELSPKAYDGFGASERGALTGTFGNEAGQATTEMQNVVTSNALASLRSIFGGNPTEGERQILLEIQGSANQPRAVREKIFERAKSLAERRLEYNKQRANSLRGGDYYKNGGQAPQQPAAPAGGTVGNLKWSVD